MQGITIYRELGSPSPSLVKWLDARNQLFEVQDPNGDTHLYIDNDIPRDADITNEICGYQESQQGDMHFPGLQGCTIGFAIFADEPDEKGNYPLIGRYRSLDRAEKAAASAKIVVKAEVEGVEGGGWNSLETAPGDDI